MNRDAGARNPWARRRKIALAEMMDEPWIMFPEDSVSGSYIEQTFRTKGLRFPQRRVTSFSMQMRLHLLSSGHFLTVLHDSVLRFNAERWSLKALPVDLRIQPVPIIIFTAKNRTLSPVVNLFVEEAHKVASSMLTVARYA